MFFSLRKIIVRILLFVLIFSFVMEISARIDDKLTYNAPLWKKYDYSILLEYDEEGLRHNVPNARFEKWKINSLGFRGPEIEAEKKKQFRIVCLGASETFGLYESEGQEWPSQLASMLKNKYPHVEIINASVVGLGANKIKTYLEKYVMPLNPDLLILYQGFYDHAVKQDHEENAIPKNAKPKTKSLRRIREELKDQVRILSKLKETIKKCLPDWLGTQISIWKSKRAILRRQKAVLKDKAPWDEVSEQNILAFESYLEEFLVYFKKKSIVPVFSTYPTLITKENSDKYKKIILDYRRFVVELSEEGMIDASNKFNEAIKRISRRLNVAWVDNNGLIPKTTEYFGDNVHYTDKGAQVVARNFYHVLNHSGLIPSEN
jgi:lysophospholipase L1-like esterase